MKAFWRNVALFTLVFLVVFTSIIAITVHLLSRDLPDLAAVEQIRPKLSTVITSADGQILKTFAIQKRTLVAFDDLPPALTDALLASEDREFWSHWGVNPISFVRASLISLVTLSPPRATSTLTQQLARDLFLTKERSLIRKIKEAIVATRIERTYTKKEIIQLYLNQVYFGAGAYGVQAAARTYFGCDARDLTTEQCATLVGMLPAPNYYNPIRNPERALARRNVVLGAMGATRKLPKSEVARLQALPLVTTPGLEELGIAPYFTEYIRIRLSEQLQKSDSLRIRFAQVAGLPDTASADQLIYEGGFVIETTLDSRLQQIAERVLFARIDSMQAYYDRAVRAQNNINSPWVDRERSLATGSIVAKRVQAALLAMDVRTGAILAMVGGRDFDATKFNRAVQALRQPGSSFKPFVYTAAIDNGFSPVTEIPNQPVTLSDPQRGEWRPENYDGSIGGPMTLREALAKSVNLVAIRLLLQTTPRLVIQYAENMGIKSNLPPYPSLALGVGEVRLVDLTAAYSVFPHQGIFVEPFAISRILSRDGIQLVERQISGQQHEALNAGTAFIMTKLLENVVVRGTGAGARSQFGLLRPAGGKTGTTNDYGDAWFVGFTPQICCGVWVGFDQRVNMGRGNTGAGAALPIWAQFMKEAHDVLNLPAQDFPKPPEIEAVEICDESHLAATPNCPSTYTEYFRSAEIPEPCTIHRWGRSLPASRREALRRNY